MPAQTTADPRYATVFKTWKTVSQVQKAKVTPVFSNDPRYPKIKKPEVVPKIKTGSSQKLITGAASPGSKINKSPGNLISSLSMGLSSKI